MTRPAAYKAAVPGAPEPVDNSVSEGNRVSEAERGAFADLRAFLDGLAARGIRVEVEAGQLRVEPWPAVEPEERKRLAAEKGKILELLAVSPPDRKVSESAAAGAAANPEPAPPVSASWGSAPRREDPMLPPWRRGDPSSMKLVKTLRSGLRIYHDVND